MQVVAAIGHRAERPGAVRNPVLWMPAVMVIKDELARLASAGPVAVYSDLTVGFGMQAAAAALMAAKEGLPVILAAVILVPEEAAAIEGPETLAQWHAKQRARAACTHRLGEARPYTRKEFEALARDRHRWMIDQSDLVLTSWSGTRSSETGRAMRYAVEAGRPMVNLFDQVNAVEGRSLKVG
jgi:hypothetical protein